jgi:hypothetical protein
MMITTTVPKTKSVTNQASFLGAFQRAWHFWLGRAPATTRFRQDLVASPLTAGCARSLPGHGGAGASSRLAATGTFRSGAD